MAKIKDIVEYLEKLAPLSYQEDYDNSGLIIGDLDSEVNTILICLDTTEEVVSEAIENNCELIISHHPLIFKGLKKLRGHNHVERTVIKAIQNQIAVYAIHTNLDNVKNGVNAKIAEKLLLRHTKILSPKSNHLVKLVTFIPEENTTEVLDAIHESGAGIIGDYDHCSFRVSGTGRFKPNEKAKPHIGEKEVMEEVAENRIEVIFPEYKSSEIIKTLQSSHPYEEVAYYLHPLSNTDPEIGAGMIGELEEPLESLSFLKYVKEKLQVNSIKYTPFSDQKIKKVAVCGGAGSFLLNAAKKAGAHAFISADFKYHDFFNAEGNILVADIGHYESEVFTKDLIYGLLSKKFSNIALRLSEVNTNPIRYI